MPFQTVLAALAWSVLAVIVLLEAVVWILAGVLVGAVIGGIAVFCWVASLAIPYR